MIMHPLGTAIVFANKMVFAIYGFKFVFCLTLIHTVQYAHGCKGYQCILAFYGDSIGIHRNVYIIIIL